MRPRKVSIPARLKSTVETPCPRPPASCTAIAAVIPFLLSDAVRLAAVEGERDDMCRRTARFSIRTSGIWLSRSSRARYRASTGSGFRAVRVGLEPTAAPRPRARSFGEPVDQVHRRDDRTGRRHVAEPLLEDRHDLARAIELGECPVHRESERGLVPPQHEAVRLVGEAFSEQRELFGM